MIRDVDVPADETNPIPHLSKYIKVHDYYPRFRSLLSFDLENEMPLSEIIQIDNVKLILNTVRWDGDPSKKIRLAALRKPFSSMYADWTYADSSTKYRWGAAGASLTEGVNMDYSISYASSIKWAANTIDVSAQAREWYANRTTSSFDILLLSNEKTGKWFASSEHTDINKRPKLEIVYSCAL